MSAINSIVPAPKYFIARAALTDSSPRKCCISLLRFGEGASSITFCCLRCNEQSLSNK